MTSKEEIERMAKTLCACKFSTCEDCMKQSATTAYRCQSIEQAKILVKAGIGDKKQAVKEFARSLLDFIGCVANNLIHIDIVERIINKQFTKLYGEEEIYDEN